MVQDEYIIVMTTVPSDVVGMRIANALLEKQLAPCVNMVGGVRSIYTWKGQVNDEAELILITKTRAALFEQVRAEIVANHPYECPEILAIPILAGHQPYLDWIGENTTPRANHPPTGPVGPVTRLT
ncbi:MAG: divalent-cation tolerance protein CutA [Candidatus Lokiarchaeota archaeon]|nr:divalent-cation tolerance protein CutA [Candidatus Lokiarchaeota archaeon]